MSEYTIRIHNTETNEIVDRPLDEQELKQLKKEQEKLAEHLQEAETRHTKKLELLSRLGITEEDAKLLLS